MICNHYVLVPTSGYDWESPTIISVEFADGVIPDMDFFVWMGGSSSSFSCYFSGVIFPLTFLIP